jgi:hypothetical protein
MRQKSREEFVGFLQKENGGLTGNGGYAMLSAIPATEYPGS